MLSSLKQAGKQIGRGLSRTWENIAEGWRELVHHSGEALTHFSRHKDNERSSGGVLSTFPNLSRFIQNGTVVNEFLKIQE